MNKDLFTIPEDKALIWAEGMYKEQIEGIPFSNNGMTIGVAKYVSAENKEEQEELLDNAIERTTKRYFKKLEREILNTRNDMIDKIRIQLADKYDQTGKQLKAGILKRDSRIDYLEGLLEKSNINFNKKDYE
jgi:hypothetical protein